MQATVSDGVHAGARQLFQRKRRVALAIPALLLAYFVYVFFAFDVMGLAQRARLDNGWILVSDMVSYKTQVLRDHRSGEFSTAIEGKNTTTYPSADAVDWVRIDGDAAKISLPNGQSASFQGNVLTLRIPGYGEIVTTPSRRGIDTQLPAGPQPEWLRVSNSRVKIQKPDLRVDVSKAKTAIYRYSWGWELFFFDLNSAYHGLSWTEVAHRALWDGEWPQVWNDFWHNSAWNHAEVAWALFETVLMAFLGTFGAALIAVSLAYFAAKNFLANAWVRAATRRVFDFLRGVDGLIWTVVLARAFGPGPLTGALAILLTDTGTFGKLFSETLENLDEKQVEGLKSTGASPLARNRFGVIPQILPVFMSQILYMLESNTRSATIIGAIVGGGIGLLLTQAISTAQDWEKVSYYVVLVIVMVFAMDAFSGWLRRRLIGERSK